MAIAGGLYLFFAGFYLLARKRLLLTIPTAKVRSAALGVVEVNGSAAGPYTMPAPITGKPCFLYQATAWQRLEPEKQEWKKVTDETLHLPFFVDDSTGQLLVEPLGADFDLQCDFCQEYDASSFLSNMNDVPPRVSAFLSRHGIVPAGRVRIEERLIKPEDAVFVVGTLTENPGIEVRAVSPRQETRTEARRGSERTELSKQTLNPEIIRLKSDAVPSSARDMSQQGKIAAALNRAGIANPEALSVGGVQHQSLAVDEKPASGSFSVGDGGYASETSVERSHAGKRNTAQDAVEPSDFDLTPAVVLMKGTTDPTFVISYHSSKELATGLGWKSFAMIWGGAAIMMIGVYVLLAHKGLL
ncbi:MAG: GIDE domain-containing protein [Terriglobales bacterium]